MVATQNVVRTDPQIMSGRRVFVDNRGLVRTVIDYLAAIAATAVALASLGVKAGETSVARAENSRAVGVAATSAADGIWSRAGIASGGRGYYRAPWRRLRYCWQ